MGVGGAIMWPAVLGMTFAALPARKAGLAGGLILGVAGLGNAVGPLLGGLLTEALSWRWVFVVNLPVAAFAIFLTWREIHQPHEASAGARLDLGGVVALTVATVALLVALDEVAGLGWGSATVLALLAVFVVAVAGVRDGRAADGRRRARPARRAGDTGFRAACVAVLLTAGTFFASMLFLPQFFQKLLGASALEAGLALVPLMATFGLVSLVAGTLYERLGRQADPVGRRRLLFVGITLLSLLDTEAGYLATLPGMLVLGIGFGLFISTVTTAAVTSLPAARVSLGGAILYMCQVAGGAVGLAIATTVFTSASQDRLAAELPRAASR